MIGRPRRRHTIDSSGQLRRTTFEPKGAPEVHQVETRQTKGQWLKVISLSLVSLVIVFLLWTIIASLLAFSKASDKNGTKKAPALSFLGEIQPNQLQGEGDGRVNVLLIGIGGANHPGGNLADTIMVASFDPKNKEVALLSVPRDLWVPIPGDGYSKINAAHAFGEQDAKKTGGGPVLLKKTISQILDLPIHYYVRADFSALQKIVDTLGGVTVEVDKPIVDLAYPADNMVDYSPFRLDAGVQTLDGKTALKYARSRHASSSEGSDFARAKRQQKLLQSIKEKALTVGVLANPKKVNDLIAILGSHLKTDMSLTETQRFFELWKNTDGSKVVTRVLDNGQDGPLVSSQDDERGYVLLPRSGDFSEVQQIAHTIFIDPYLRQEKARIGFVNATGNPTTGQQVMKLLTSYGYTVTDRTEKGRGLEKTSQLTDHTGGKPYTTKFLEIRFQTRATLKRDKNKPDDLTLVLGSNYRPLKLKSDNLTKKPSPTPSLNILTTPTGKSNDQIP